MVVKFNIIIFLNDYSGFEVFLAFCVRKPEERQPFFKSERAHLVHHVHSSGSHFAGQWAAVSAALLALAPNCALPALTLSFYT